MMKEMILLYHAKQEAIEILDQMHVPYKLIQEEQLHETIGYLFEMDGFPPSPKTETSSFDFDFMMIHQISDERLKEIITQLKKKNANIERKAMLTEHNQHWTLFNLLKEIDKEHMYFKVYDDIMLHLQKADAYQKETVSKEQWISYQDAFVHAYSVLQSRPEDIEILKQARSQLLEAEEKLTQNQQG